MPEDLSLEALIDVLERHCVRATYGAVGAYVNEPATFLMNDLPRTPRYSWIVNQQTLEPTGYSETEKHPRLRQTKMVLRNERQLREWLERKARKPPG